VAAAQTQVLIDKRDNSEVLRDEIGAILLVESAKQQELAQVANKEAALWALRVFLEASNPWAEWVVAPDTDSPLEDTSPIVNVSFDSENFDESKSNVVERQHAVGVFHIDCYGYGKSKGDGAGHVAGDKAAAIEAQRAVRLVRNILMSSYWTYLGQRGLVARRWIRSIVYPQIEIGGRPVQQVRVGRIALEVAFNEFSPQYQGVPLTLVSTQIARSGSNPEQILLTADFPLSP
jgi:hypothetical protein